jgi:hypothetical protein
MAAITLSPEVVALFTAITQGERDQLSAMLNEANKTAVSLAIGTTIVHAGVSKSKKKARKMTKADLACLEPPKRPLNAWMGYRSMYSCCHDAGADH